MGIIEAVIDNQCCFNLNSVANWAHASITFSLVRSCFVLFRNPAAALATHKAVQVPSTQVDFNHTTNVVEMMAHALVDFLAAIANATVA